jgi:hypothetical protein
LFYESAAYIFMTTCHLYREAVEAGRKFHGSDKEKS